MITPLPVPIHNRLQLTSKAVIRTNENPNFPDPATKIPVKIKAKVKMEFCDDFFKKENLQKHSKEAFTILDFSAQVHTKIADRIFQKYLEIFAIRMTM